MYCVYMCNVCVHVPQRDITVVHNNFVPEP